MKRYLPEIIFLLVVSAVVYLPHIGGLTYFKDDWYYIFDGMSGGAAVFHEMFRIDRPVRGFFFEWYFFALGPNPLPWHIGAFLWRTLAAVGALWIFTTLWERARVFNFFAALFFAIFPGYYWWISAIEYQPMIASLALQVISIALTMQAVLAPRTAVKAAYLAGAALTGWAYIALVDYAIGMEVFRFLCVYLLVSRGEARFWDRMMLTFKAWAWNVLIPLGFMVWRALFFTNERAATDIGTQLGVFLGHPIATGIAWLYQIYNSLLTVSVLAWVSQFPAFNQWLRLRDTAAGLLVAAAAAGLVMLAVRRINISAGEKAGVETPPRVWNEALLLGGLGMIGGVLPVVMANRYINLTFYSHYGLPVSLAAALFTAACLGLLSAPRIQKAMLFTLTAFAALAHHGIAVQARIEETALQKFWWQVNWRAPALREGTLLVIQYPLSSMGDDGLAVIEAANVMYFPGFVGRIPVQYPLSGLTVSSSVLPDILDGTQYESVPYRSHVVNYDYSNLLVISQPTVSSCVHVLDGREPLISVDDLVGVTLASPSSRIENVIVDAVPAVPQPFIFGAEPQRSWCYYFQKADLAAQMGDWATVVALGEEALALRFSPEDRVEWLPFLKAYAITGNAERLEQLAKRVVGERSIRLQICEMFSRIEQHLNGDVQQVVDRVYCKNSE
jgi:hypothetical protein